MKFWLTVKGDGNQKNSNDASGRRCPLFCCLKSGVPGLERECRLVRQPRSLANKAFESVIAIAVGVVKQVRLMIWLREPKLAGCGLAENLGCNRPSTGLGKGFPEGLPGLLGQLALLRSSVNNHRTVLTAPIVTLPLALSGVVVFPKHFQQVSRARAGGVVDYAGSFGVPSLTCTDIFISGVRPVTSQIAYRRVDDPGLAPKNAFHSPKTSHRYVKNLVGKGPRPGERGFEHGVNIGQGGPGIVLKAKIHNPSVTPCTGIVLGGVSLPATELLDSKACFSR